MRFVTVALTVAGLWACVDGTGPELPAAELFDPPPAYRGWWRDIEGCSGRGGGLDALTFYRVVPAPGRDSLHYRDPDTGHYLLGQWVPRSNAIYLAAGQVANPHVVRHEMLHAVLRDIAHPRGYFADRCGELVSY